MLKCRCDPLCRHHHPSLPAPPCPSLPLPAPPCPSLPLPAPLPPCPSLPLPAPPCPSPPTSAPPYPLPRSNSLSSLPKPRPLGHALVLADLKWSIAACIVGWQSPCPRSSLLTWPRTHSHRPVPWPTAIAFGPRRRHALALTQPGPAALTRPPRTRDRLRGSLWLEDLYHWFFEARLPTVSSQISPLSK